MSVEFLLGLYSHTVNLIYPDRLKQMLDKKGASEQAGAVILFKRINIALYPFSKKRIMFKIFNFLHAIYNAKRSTNSFTKIWSPVIVFSVNKNIIILKHVLIKCNNYKYVLTLHGYRYLNKIKLDIKSLIQELTCNLSFCKSSFKALCKPCFA